MDHHQGIEPGWRELAPSTTVPADQPDDLTLPESPPSIGKPIRQPVRTPARRTQRVVTFLLFTAAIIMMTFALAQGLVHGSGAFSFTRVGHALADAYASAEYRKARIACQRFAGEERDNCIALAHAEEGRARAFAATARGSQLAAARVADEEARAPYGIIVDPACNLIAGARGRNCEIQVGDRTAVGMQATNLIPARTVLNLARNNASAVPAWRLPAPAVPASRLPVAAGRPAPARAAQAPARATQDSMFQMAWSARQ